VIFEKLGGLDMACICLFLLGSVSNMSIAQSNNSPTAIIDFQRSQELDNWVIINDTVMGGRSRARLTINDSYLLFSGTLSLENNGGFASVRRVHNGKVWLSDKPIKIQVKGDGREYQLRFRINRRVDSVHYGVSFKTKANEVTVFQFNESDFVPQFRGRILKDAPALNFANIEQVGVLIADSIAGDFMLMIESISQLPDGPTTSSLSW
jgi:NADH dehydrogenase [ubiquinone] 1 alpha subcomplex assembly factor 1